MEPFKCKHNKVSLYCKECDVELFDAVYKRAAEQAKKNAKLLKKWGWL